MRLGAPRAGRRAQNQTATEACTRTGIARSYKSDSRGRGTLGPLPRKTRRPASVRRPKGKMEAKVQA
jgi:hypothetical protein